MAVQITSSAGLTLNGGTFQILTSTINTDRMNDSAPISLDGGTFLFLNNVVSSFNEAMGPMSIDAGQSYYGMTTSGPTKRACASVVNFSRTHRATATIEGTSLGTPGSFNSPSGTTAYLKIIDGTPTDTNETNFIASLIGGGATGSSTHNNSIVPYLLGATAGGDQGTTFLGYTSSAGFVALEYV